MSEKTLYQLREEVQRLLEKGLQDAAARDAAKSEAPAGQAHVIVTVTPYNDIAVMIISPAVEGLDSDERDALLWPVLEENLSPDELGLLSRWEILSTAEALLVYPSILKRRRADTVAA